MGFNGFGRAATALALFVAVFALALPVQAEAPDSDSLRARIAEALPGYWQIENLEIAAEANRGDAVDPRWAQRLEVDLLATATLYRADPRDRGELRPFAVLVETFPKGTARKLYLVSTAVREQGVWDIRLRFENGVEELGQPRDLFDAPTLVIGSEAYDEAVATLSAPARERVQAERAAALAQVRAEGAVELEKLRAELAAAEDALAIEAAALAERRERQLAEADAALQQTLAEVAVKTEERIREAEAAVEAELAHAKEQTAVYSALAEALRAQQAAQAEAAASRRDLYRSVQRERAAMLETVLGDLESEQIARRVAGFDAAMAAGGAFLRSRAIAAALGSEDAALFAHALASEAVLTTPSLATAAVEALVKRGDMAAIEAMLSRLEPASPAAVAVANRMADQFDAETAVKMAPELIAAGGEQIAARFSGLMEPFGTVTATVRTKLYDSWPGDARQGGFDERGRLISKDFSGDGSPVLLSHPAERNQANGFIVDTMGLPLALTLRAHDRGNGTYAVFADGTEIHREEIGDKAFVRRVIEIPEGTKEVEVRHLPVEWSWEHLYFTEMGPAFVR